MYKKKFKVITSILVNKVSNSKFSFIIDESHF